MKKYASLLLISLFAVLTVLILVYRKPAPVYTLIERKNVNDAEWDNSKQAIENLLAAIRTNPGDLKSKLKLAYAYIQEGRTSGNHAYYDKAALSLCDEILDKQMENYEAICAKATVLLSQHHFSEAKPLAEKAITINPYNSAAYGILTDSYVELGDYKKAITAADKMVSTRPDIRSYSRVSYLREIMGDTPGAIDAMKLAVSCGYPGYEQTAWTRCQLARLYENTTQLDNANLQYEIALSERPMYAFAIAGQGRLAKSNGNYPLAIQKFELASRLVNDFSFDQELTELYHLNSEPKKAYEYSQKTIEDLAGISGKESESNHGHYADRELAYAYLNAYDYSLALRHALIEYHRRPENIDVNQTLAWVYYKLGDYNNADKYMNVAMKTNSKNPVLLYEAGLVKKAAGNFSEGNQLMSDALKRNPFLSPVLKWEGSRQVALLN
ncbi:MAG: tetratricopeptide repeat protein [Bacteroidetes bacterium]|nr:tetratricopeptide repeat protein [Bacteroidota bacterium]